MRSFSWLNNAGVLLTIITLSGFNSTTQSEDEAVEADEKWIHLFNGKDLAGWQTYDIVNGFDNDVHRIYSVVHEDGQPAEEALLGRIKEAVAPVDRGVQRLLPGRRVARTTHQEARCARSGIQSSQHSPGRQHAAAGGRQRRPHGLNLLPG